MYKNRIWATMGCCLIFAITIVFAQDKNPVITGGSSPLVNASVSGNIDVVRELIEKGADVNGRDELGNFPLYAAVTGNHADVIELLIKKGANVNQLKAGDVLPKDERNTTALHAATIVGNQAVVELLVNAGADVNAFADLNEENEKRIKNMLENPQTSRLLKPERLALLQTQLRAIGVTPLMLASKSNHANIAAFLLDRGADINFQKPGSNTALIEAAIAGKRDVIELLVSRNADLNRVGENGGTALTFALLNEQYESARILMAAGADFQLNDHGRIQWKKPFSWGAYQLLVAQKLTAEGNSAETKEKLTDALASLTKARDELNKAADALNMDADKLDTLADKIDTDANKLDMHADKADLDKGAKRAERWATVDSIISVVSVVAAPALSYSASSAAQSLRDTATLDRSMGRNLAGKDHKVAPSLHNLAVRARNDAASGHNSAQGYLEKAAACDSLIQKATKLLNDVSGTEKAP
jgi:ankyrin repeat protein